MSESLLTRKQSAHYALRRGVEKGRVYELQTRLFEMKCLPDFLDLREKVNRFRKVTFFC